MAVPWRVAVLVVVSVVLVLSGPAVGLVDLSPGEPDSTGLGDGSATVSMQSDPAADLRLDRGRFGTGVYYLRIPPAVVDVSALDGRPQLTYKLSIPRLEYSDSTRQLLTDGGRIRADLRDRAFAPSQLKHASYRVELVVRIQSFETDRVRYRQNVTITPPAGS